MASSARGAGDTKRRKRMNTAKGAEKRARPKLAPSRAPRARKRRQPQAKVAAKPRAKGLAAAAGEIRHVVLLMLENRSFDQMLGALQQDIPAIDGVPTTGPPRFNDADGVRYPQQLGAANTAKPDLPHEFVHVKKSLENANAGFVERYAAVHPDTDTGQREQVMRCFDVGRLPALHALARNFVVCDHWHASVPGPTWPNRLFAMSGTSLGHVDMPGFPVFWKFHRYQQPSVFKRLTQKSRTYRIYFGDVPLALLLEDQRKPEAAKSFAKLARFFEDVNRPEAEFPDFVFIEPDYLWPSTNDDHPPHDVQDGQRLIADVYDALRGSKDPELWNSTLLVVLYDEHGGFYDHVVPPTDGVVAPDGSPGERGFRFDQLGVRVPAILVSPLLDPGVFSGRFDHTSLLRYLQLNWSLGDLGKRVAAAQSPLGGHPLRPTPRGDTPVTLPRPPAATTIKTGAKAKAAAPRATDHQRAVIALAEFLATQTTAPPKTKSAAAAKAHKGAADASIVARQRAERFLEQQRGTRL